MNNYKQYCKLVCKETNVKTFSLHICNTEKGEMTLNYHLDNNQFNFTIGEEEYWSENLERLGLKVLNKYYE